MIYLKNFKLLSERQEHDILFGDMRNIYNNYYPIGIFPLKGLFDIEFSDITIFYGGNGSGKTTLLNVISEKLNANRKTFFDKGNHFDMYVKSCKNEMDTFKKPYEVKNISSDDVFDYLLDIKSINANVNRMKDSLSEEYLNIKFNKREDNISNYEELKSHVEVNKKSMSRFVRERLGNNNIIRHSNGEEALLFWEREIKENSIYILDEPENSLSAENQLKLKKFIEESIRFYNCQFIISTHSPFLLKLMDARIYNLDEYPVSTKNWEELPNVQIYYNFFKEYEKEFDKKND